MSVRQGTAKAARDSPHARGQKCPHEEITEFVVHQGYWLVQNTSYHHAAEERTEADPKDDQTRLGRNLADSFNKCRALRDADSSKGKCNRQPKQNQFKELNHLGVSFQRLLAHAAQSSLASYWTVKFAARQTVLFPAESVACTSSR